jgi:hypothetical protein
MRPASRAVSRIALAAAAAATAAAAGAHADTNRNELSLGGTARALRSSSANAITPDNLAGVSLGAAHDLGLALRPQLALWAEAGLTTGTASGVMFQSLSTDLDELGLTGGLAARYRVHRLIAVSARVALGAQRIHLRVGVPSSSSSSSSQSGDAWGATASAGAALDVFATARPPFGLGVRLELGYVAAQSVGLTLHRDMSDLPSPLALRDFMLGRVDLSGPSAAVSLLGQF